MSPGPRRMAAPPPPPPPPPHPTLSTVSPTASDSMLAPRRANTPATRLISPDSSATNTLSMCLRTPSSSGCGSYAYTSADCSCAAAAAATCGHGEGERREDMGGAGSQRGSAVVKPPATPPPAGPTASGCSSTRQPLHATRRNQRGQQQARRLRVGAPKHPGRTCDSNRRLCVADRQHARRSG